MNSVVLTDGFLFVGHSEGFCQHGCNRPFEGQKRIGSQVMADGAVSDFVRHDTTIPT